MQSPLSTTRAELGIAVRPAEPGDLDLVMILIRELAAYEKLLDAVQSDAASISEALFCPQPRVFCDIVALNGTPAGFAVWFYNFSTFRGRHGIFLEDLFIRPAFRGQGLGKALLRHLARRCIAENLPRMEWSVLDWNAPSIAFYQAQGAALLDDWTTCRLTGDALIRLGAPE